MHHNSLFVSVLFGVSESVAMGCEQALGRKQFPHPPEDLRRWGETYRKSGNDKARPLADLADLSDLAQLLALIMRACSQVNESVQK